MFISVFLSDPPPGVAHLLLVQTLAADAGAVGESEPTHLKLKKPMSVSAESEAQGLVDTSDGQSFAKLLRTTLGCSVLLELQLLSSLAFLFQQTGMNPPLGLMRRMK